MKNSVKVEISQKEFIERTHCLTVWPPFLVIWLLCGMSLWGLNKENLTLRCWRAEHTAWREIFFPRRSLLLPVNFRSRCEEHCNGLRKRHFAFKWLQQEIFFSTSAVSEIWQLLGYNVGLHAFITVVCFFFLGLIDLLKITWKEKATDHILHIARLVEHWTGIAEVIRLPFTREIYWLCFHSCLSSLLI